MAADFADLHEWLATKLRRQNARQPAASRMTFGDLLEHVRAVPRQAKPASAGYDLSPVVRDGQSWVRITAYEHALGINLAGVVMRLAPRSQLLVLASQTLVGAPDIEVIDHG